MGTSGIAAASTERSSSRVRRIIAAIAFAAVLGTALVAVQPADRAVASSPCGPTVNAIVCENEQEGTSPDVWDIEGAGDPTIQGFATDISVNAGQRIDFKIDTDAPGYTIDVYRTGWYQGLGARHIDSVTPTRLGSQTNECISDVATELYDCGTWDVSASWAVPATAVSGVYVARLQRDDTAGASHITFIVRNDGNTSDVLFQTSDPTWHAYNSYGGSDFYQGAANGRAYKISYNRPFATRQGYTQRDFYFSSEYATVRFLERNGYDVSYIAGLDTDRRGSELLNHKVFMSVGHDEYWSGAQRANIEAARDAGVNMQFLTGNEGYWRTRYEPSADGSLTDRRTLVSYKETWADKKIDPTPEWTGTWRDPRFADAAQGGHSPENSVTGTMYMVNDVYLPVTVDATEGDYRLWRDTGLSDLDPGEAAELTAQTVGYESNEDVDNGFRPAGLIRLSTTVGPTPQYLTDYGNVLVDGTTMHHVTLYRADSDALVFSSASIQWSWGLDSQHDGQQPPADPRMQQAQVNLFADMGVQPGSLMPELTRAEESDDETPPTTTITSPTAGQQLTHGRTVTVTGTASDVGGSVAGVEVSTDGGASWHPATGTTNWSYDYLPQGSGTAVITARAIDDSANFSRVGISREVSVSGPATVFGDTVPAIASADDPEPVELGMRITPSSDGYLSAIRFYKGPGNTGVHTGTLWDAAGNRVASVVFANETATGWQTAPLSVPVPVTAGSEYTVSYTAPAGGYAIATTYWPYRARASAPLAPATGPGTPGVSGRAGTLPTSAWRGSNYFVDAVFEATDSSPLRIASRTPQADSSSVALDAPVNAVFTRAADPATVAVSVTDPSGAELPGSVSYDAASRTVRFAPTGGYAPSTRYTVTPSASDPAGVALEPNAAWSFTTQAADLPEGVCPCTLFPESSRPQFATNADTSLVTLGVRFTVAAPGTVTTVSFFRGSGNTAPHWVTLYRADGSVLGSGTSVNESSSGWQHVALDQPAAVVPGETYVAAYLAPAGAYPVSPDVFGAGYTRGPLTVPALGGAYTYADGFPANASSTDYAVDVTFVPDAVALDLIGTTPSAGAADAPADTTLSASFSAAVSPGFAGAVTAAGAPVSGTWARSDDGRTLTFAPAADLPAGAVVSAALTGLVGPDGRAGADVSWSFTVEQTATPRTTIFGNALPSVVADSDSSPVELGLSFRSSVPGEVRAIRFYKGPGNGGTHTGSLWGPGGERLAQVTFRAETPSGWQRAVLDQPVEITAGTSYTVSYYAPQGHYANTGAALTAPITSGPLTTEAPENGVYRYGPGGLRPVASWNSTNYFVDVEFVVDSDAAAPVPQVQAVTPARDATDVAIDASVSARVDRLPVGQSLSMTLTGPGGAVGGAVTSTPDHTFTFAPFTELAVDTLYTAQVTIDGSALDSWTFRTTAAAGAGTTDTLFGTADPAATATNDGDPVELGTAFQVTESGTVTALRFFATPQSVGTHRVTLWSADGRVLAQQESSGETGSGWQRVELAAPVDVVPGDTYTASYLATDGRFAIANDYFVSPRTNGRIVAPAGENGRFLYRDGGGFPTGSWRSSSYFVDAEISFGTDSGDAANVPRR
ncbi:DUF4082 domain-containing protein [Microbacterium sp. cx-55]|uniref:DUF4082 domain-containing protein n=1 Tax=Microbacterium sp. cx-55 TaxID=2875948 RepID=UPI001CBE7D8F|nr:DUF4082 domain-containing protein [Microbacterium sp. cx-55]MBZ4486895.1 DUF4082 domain-containing protein [Microbacterium sp. cx-55]UGB35819.1 DUF4082 domain-containing protein [Microbacterium sp. cx-55]